MSPFEEIELEGCDLFCENCECIISTKEYINNQGLCNKCAEN